MLTNHFKPFLASDDIGLGSSPSFSQSIDLSRPLTERVNLFLEAADRVAKDLANQVEAIKPNHLFGMSKNQHMIKLADRSDELGEKYGIDAQLRPFIRAINRTHDFGRFEEAIGVRDTLRSGVRHGTISVQILEDNNLFRFFTDAEKAIVATAISQHSEKTPQLPDDLTHRLCYVLCDQDKLDALSEKKFVRPDGILAQIGLHYVGDSCRYFRALGETQKDRGDLYSQLMKEPDFKNIALEIISDLWNGRDIDLPVGLSNEQSHCLSDITRIMSGNVNPQAIGVFLEGKIVPLDLMREDYASYMLVQIGFTNDVYSPGVRQDIRDNGLLLERLDFVSRRTSEDDFRLILNQVNK